jgi:hypothetical protein
LTRKYSTDIERLIFDLLFQKDKPVSYTELYNSVKGTRKTLSHETFNIHLSHLKGNGLLGNIAKRYFLQQKAYFLDRLKILEFNRPNKTFLDPFESQEVEKRLKMLFIVSYYSPSRWFYPLQNRGQFQEFLSRYNLKEIDLKVSREYDLEKKGSATHFKHFFPDRVHDIEIRIVEQTGKISYGYFLPGFNMVEIWKDVERRRLEFYYVDFARSDLQQEIDMLMSQGLLERIGEIDNEMRYRFPQRLQLVLAECWKLNDDLFGVMMRIFEYLRSPNKAEKKWLEFFYGNIEDLLRDLRHNRGSKKGKKRNSVRNIKQSMLRIFDDFENLIDSQNLLANLKHRLFVQKLLEYIYPAFMRHMFSSAIVV